MNNARPILIRILKTAIWVVVGFVFLFLIIAVLIQVPVIQNKIIGYATNFVSKKTHTHVEIKRISILFPKTVAVSGIFLDDVKGDTLLYAGNVNINIAFTDLLSNKISVNNIELENVTLNVARAESDSLFNYNFLLRAFSDTADQVKTEPAAPSKWTFSLDNVDLKDIRINYNDEYGGMNVNGVIEDLALVMDEFDLQKSIYGIDKLLIEGLNAHVIMTKAAPVSESESATILPKITADKIAINRSTVTYDDSISKLSVIAAIQLFELKEGSIDLQKQIVSLADLSLSNSEFKYLNSNSDQIADTTAAKPASTNANHWSVSAKNIDLEDNSLVYRVGDGKAVKNGFDANQLQYKHVTLAAKNLLYSTDSTKISIKKFKAIDQNNFSIENLATDFTMDQHSITAKGLKAQTTNSTIVADLNLQYSSLRALKDSIPYLVLNLNMKNVSVANADILYFNPELEKQPFFRNRTMITKLTGIVNGRVNDLSGKNILLKTGDKTTIETNFTIRGLPDAQTAYFDFPNLKINSNKRDIDMMAGTMIPENIAVPQNINMDVVFKGRIKAFESTINMKSSFGNADCFATVDKDENFRSKLTISSFDLGSLLKDTAMFGPISLTAEANGQGLNDSTIKAKVNAQVSEVFFNHYTYHQLNLDGNISGEEFEGTVNLNDKNAVIDFDGLVSLNKDRERIKFQLAIKGADLQKLNFTKEDIRIGLVAQADLKGGSMNKMNGKAGITNMVIAKGEKKYVLDSLLFASVNEPNKSEFNFSSALVGVKYSGTLSPVDISAELNNFMNTYFKFTESNQEKKTSTASNFHFEVEIHNHPIISQILFPQLTEFEAGTIKGDFDSKKNELKLNADFKKIVYGATEVNDFHVAVNSNAKELNYALSTSSILNSQAQLDNFLFNGKLADNTLFANVSSIDGKKNKKIEIHSRVTKENDNYRLALDPKDFYLMNNPWNIAADNYIEFGKEGFLIHRFFIKNAQSEINISSVNDRFNDDLKFEIKNFKLDDLSRIVQKDSSLIKGNVDGNILLKRLNDTYGIVADASIENLVVREVPIGNLTVKAQNPTSGKYDFDINLTGSDNKLTSNGYFEQNEKGNSINIKTAIESLSMKTIEAFSMGQIKEATGNLSGDLLVQGTTSAPEITGKLVFGNVFIKPAILNNRLELKNQTIQFDKQGVTFNSFTLLDTDQHTAIIDGTVQMNKLTDFIFALNVRTRDFLLFNSTAKDNKSFYGRMIIDSQIDVKGPMSLPEVNGRLKMKEGSNFTFAVPESELTTDKGEDVVVFENTNELNPIIDKKVQGATQKSALTGFDLSSIVEIDKKATLRLLMDPSSTDSLVVKGDAALNFSMDRTGKMNLTGAYNLDEGSYVVSLQSVIKRKFEINSGSRIVWNSDPLDAEVNIDAIYSVRAAPYDLVADQMSGLSSTEQGGYKQKYPINVVLKLRGEILHPIISFEIKLPPEEKGVLGGALNQKLELLNNDLSALNKQVFALLVLGRFIQENPLQTESGGTSALVRSTVGNFLSAELNKLGSKILPGTELNFDVQSYDDYQTGQAQGRTQVDIGIKQQLFNERMSVQVGGSVDVEGEKAKQNSASNITSDVTIEYKLTKDGRFRLKGFRKNQYEDPIEGQYVETGAGILYSRDFNNWKDLFRSPKKKRDVSKKEKNDETVNTK